MACELQERETEQAVRPQDTTTEWVTGEYDVTGALGGNTDDHWARARDAAIDAARDLLQEKYTCVGTCDGFCVLDVNVESNRAGRRIRRTVGIAPDSIPYQQGRRETERTYLTYEIKGSAACRCAQRSEPSIIPSPPVPKGWNWDPGPEEDFIGMRWGWTPGWRLALRWQLKPGFVQGPDVSES